MTFPVHRATTVPTPDATAAARAVYRKDTRPYARYVLTVDGEEYGSFGEEENVKKVTDLWTCYLEGGGHPLTDDEKELCRRDTPLECAITFREYLGGPAWTPNLWEVFRYGRRVSRYRTELGALRRIERLTAESHSQPHR